MKRLKGTIIAQGITLGRACLYQEDLLEAAPRLSILEDKVEEERKRLLKAVTKTIEDLRKVYEQVSRSLSAMEAEIFNAHIMILSDSSFIKKIEKYIFEEKVNAEAAILKSIKLYEKQFKMLPDDYLRERIQDINDIARRLLRNLGVEHKGFMCACPKDEQVVVVADDLTPSLITGLDHKPVAAIVTERGSTISHGAILARALGVPAMIGVNDLISNISCGTTVLIDADKGDLYLSPDSETISRYGDLLNKPITVEKKYGLGYVSTKDGARIQLAANAGSVADIDSAQKHGLKDVGLFRTEFIFLGRQEEPDIKEQVEIYAKIINSTDGTVTFRLLDIGGDKLLGYLPLPKQDNPNLGLRGVRIYDKYPDIIANQIKALLMAKGEKPMRIMVPMISTLEEFRQTRERIYRIAKRDDSNLKVGCMIEVPSALYIIKDLVDEADFLSIGTNDLIQYLMGTDRCNLHLSEYLEPLQPAVLKVLDSIIKETGESGKEISVCGEMAGDPGMARILVGLGYRHLSLNPHLIDKVGEVIGQNTLEGLEKEARELLKVKTLAGIKQILLERK